MNQFTELYKTYSNSELIRVIENQLDYQNEAVEAAKLEIYHRNLSDSVLTNAKSDLESERLEKTKQKEKIAETKRKLKSFENLVFETINPIQKSASTSERLIRLILIVFGFIAVVKVINEFSFVKSILSDSRTLSSNSS